MSLLNYTDAQIEEFRLCRASPVYFLRKYFHIAHPKNGKILFDMYPCQEQLVQAYHLNINNISLSARQTGSTTCSIGYALWSALFRPNFKVIIASNKFADAKHIIAHILFAYDFLPDWMKLKLTTRNRSEIAFENGSLIIAAIANRNTCRGQSVGLFIWDNAMWTREQDAFDMWDTVTPVLAMGSKSIVTCSGTKRMKPNEANLFQELWYNALKNTNSFVITHTRWDAIPGRGEDFKCSTINYIGEEAWRREYECEFVTE